MQGLRRQWPFQCWSARCEASPIPGFCLACCGEANQTCGPPSGCTVQIGDSMGLECTTGALTRLSSWIESRLSKAGENQAGLITSHFSIYTETSYNWLDQFITVFVKITRWGKLYYIQDSEGSHAICSHFAPNHLDRLLLSMRWAVGPAFCSWPQN